MRRLTYENTRGNQIEFYLTPFLIESLTGIGDLESDHYTQKSPYQDGLSYIETNFKPRYIDLEGSIMERNFKSIRMYRSMLSSICNPKLGLGKLTLELDGITREIYCVPNSAPVFPERERMPVQSFTITWFCPDPYWRSPNQESRPLKSYVGKFKLPMTFPFELGTSGSRTTLYNDGDVPAPVTVEIHGPTTNPQLFNRTTGEHIRINRTISDDEILHVNTKSGSQRVEIERNGESNNAFGYLDHDSSALSDFCLELGENEIEHVADAGNRHAQVIVRWQDQFVGV